MKTITIIILGNKFELPDNENVELVFSSGENLIQDVAQANGKYIAFIKSDDIVSDNYLNKILDVCDQDFDSCFINYNLDYNYLSKMKTLANEKVLSINKPYAFEYVWNYIYRKEKLLVLLNRTEQNEFNKTVDNIFLKNIAIKDVIYFHNPNGQKILANSLLVDLKKTVHYKNIIYICGCCSGMFNGYISWVNNIGRRFSDDYDIVLLYDNLMQPTFDSFSKYFKLVKYDSSINYTCDRLLVTFSTYYYPKNIYPLESSYLFIHANMSDYPRARKYIEDGDDLYSKYIAVSKVSAKKADGYFAGPIEYVYNPFKLDKDLIVPHLKLVSAQRSTAVKKIDRLEILASVFDELSIPYTWNVFTDAKKPNKNGLIFRNRVSNPWPYIKDSDYFVLLSDSEACPYSILEALSLNTKVIVTPLEAFKELGVNDENGFMIPFEYFEPINKDKLKEVVLKIYNDKTKHFDYQYDEKMCKEYENILKK